MPNHELPESIDRRRYDVLQDELTDAVTAQYQQAYTLLRSGQDRKALEAFRTLLHIYPATGKSEIVSNVNQLASQARHRAAQ